MQTAAAIDAGMYWNGMNSNTSAKQAVALDKIRRSNSNMDIWHCFTKPSRRWSNIQRHHDEPTSTTKRTFR